MLNEANCLRQMLDTLDEVEYELDHDKLKWDVKRPLKVWYRPILQ
jgi:hypothetical protein